MTSREYLDAQAPAHRAELQRQVLDMQRVRARADAELLAAKDCKIALMAGYIEHLEGLVSQLGRGEEESAAA